MIFLYNTVSFFKGQLKVKKHCSNFEAFSIWCTSLKSRHPKFALSMIGDAVLVDVLWYKPSSEPKGLKKALEIDKNFVCMDKICVLSFIFLIGHVVFVFFCTNLLCIVFGTMEYIKKIHKEKSCEDFFLVWDKVKNVSCGSLKKRANIL